MNNKIVNFIMFVGGAALGSVVTWKLLEKKYQQRVQEEVDSVKEEFAKWYKKDEPENSDESAVSEEKQADIREFRNLLEHEGYVDYTISDKNEAKKEEIVYLTDRPHIIEYEEFGEIDEYETLSLTYYEDGILTDDADDPMENIDFIVGTENLTRLNEDEDVIYVRNDQLKIDYEISLAFTKYEAKYGVNTPDEDD